MLSGSAHHDASEQSIRARGLDGSAEVELLRIGVLSRKKEDGF